MTTRATHNLDHSLTNIVQRAERLVSKDQLIEQVIRWQQIHGRHSLPWQQNADPYHVMVSEFMLQQTQVQTVIPYYKRWLETLPTIHELANADDEVIMHLWQGLGYYRRAHNLKRAAQTVCENYAGKLPSTPNELREIPGIGPYTAGAITAFAFNKPAAIVDGNVKRFFARLFQLEVAVNKPANDKYFWALAEHYQPTSNAQRYAQGLLDLGATICKPRQPNCDACPFNAVCASYKDGVQNDYPKRVAKHKPPIRPGHFGFDLNADGLLLERRSNQGIWPQLWCLPEVAEPNNDSVLHGEFKHTFTHYKLEARVWHQQLDGATESYERVPVAEVTAFALPTPIRRYLESYLRTS